MTRPIEIIAGMTYINFAGNWKTVLYATENKVIYADGTGSPKACGIDTFKQWVRGEGNLVDIKEVISVIEYVTWQASGRNCGKIVAVKDIAIEALEKQIAKKPKEEPFFDIMRRKNVQRILCPVCGECLTTVEFESEKVKIFNDYKCVKHCIECGQRIDWNIE